MDSTTIDPLIHSTDIVVRTISEKADLKEDCCTASVADVESLIASLAVNVSDAQAQCLLANQIDAKSPVIALKVIANENPIALKANLATNPQKNGSSNDYVRKTDIQPDLAEYSKLAKSDVDNCVSLPSDITQRLPAIPKLAITESIAIPAQAPSESHLRVDGSSDENSQEGVQNGSPNAPDSSSGSSPDAVFTPAGSIGTQTSSSVDNDKEVESRLPHYKDLMNFRKKAKTTRDQIPFQ
ncbi:hypothetical protein V1504DRAFT_60173 [Lipomyces starkeyi]